MGQKIQSDRPAPADQPDLGQPLVRRRRATMAGCCSRISKIRKFIMKTLPQAAISKVVIERPAKLCRVSIYAARPGVIIGKKGADIEKLRKQLGAMTASRREAQHRRDPQAGDRRQARRAGRRRPAGAPHRVPPGDEARGAVGAASRRRGHPDHLRRPSRRRRDRADRMVSRRPRAAAHAARQRRLCRGRPRTPPMASAASRCWIFKGEILGHDPMAQDRLMMEAQTSGVRPAR